MMLYPDDKIWSATEYAYRFKGKRNVVSRQPRPRVRSGQYRDGRYLPWWKRWRTYILNASRAKRRRRGR